MNGALIMAAVAIVCGLLAAFLVLRPQRSEASVYRNRIAATMLIAAAVILAGFAWALYSWDAAA